MEGKALGFDGPEHEHTHTHIVFTFMKEVAFLSNNLHSSPVLGRTVLCTLNCQGAQDSRRSVIHKRSHTWVSVELRIRVSALCLKALLLS